MRFPFLSLSIALSLLTSSVCLFEIISFGFKYNSAFANENCYSIARVKSIEDSAWVFRNKVKMPLKENQILCRDDEVELTKRARVIVTCNVDGSDRIFLPGLRYPVISYCSVVHRCDDGGCSLGDEDSVSEDKMSIPNIINPRQTALLNTMPKLIWDEVPGATNYLITIRREPFGVIWETKVKETEVLYSGSPPLNPGPSYTIIIESDNGYRFKSTKFSILNERDRDLVNNYLKSNSELDNNSLILTKLGLYLRYKLRAEAIELLSKSILQGDGSSVIFRELGDIYWEVKLFDLAKESYLKAIELAKNSDDLRGEALASARLGELYKEIQDENQGNQFLERARMLYHQIGDPEIIIDN